MGEKYALVYFVSNYMEFKINEFNEVKSKKKMKSAIWIDFEE